MASKKTVIVTGASQGIGAAVVQAFLGRSYNIVATSRSVSKAGFALSPNLALVDGDNRDGGAAGPEMARPSCWTLSGWSLTQALLVHLPFWSPKSPRTCGRTILWSMPT